MEIRIEKPPIYDEAHKHFKIDDKITCYTYGDILYNPAGFHIDPYLMTHEETHAKQHREHERGAAGWWEQYFADPQFRHDQELEAYQNQYKHFATTHPNRAKRERYLNIIATYLSSPMYAAGTTAVEAKANIHNGVHK